MNNGFIIVYGQLKTLHLRFGNLALFVAQKVNIDLRAVTFLAA